MFSMKPGVRVLQVGKFYPPHRGGMESHLEGLCLGLKDVLDVHVVVANSAMETKIEEVADSLRIERVGTAFTVAGASICPSMVQSIRRQLSAEIVHIHLPNPTAVLAYLASRHPGKLIVTYHSDVIRQEVLSKPFQPILDTLLRRSAAIICTSPNYIDTSPVLRRFRDKCHVIPLGVAVKLFDLVNPQHVDAIRTQFGQNLILSAGRHVYYKGFEYLIRAMGSVSGKLLLIGDGPLRGELQQITRRLDLEAKVKFLGEVEDVAPYFHAADVFALPSIARSEAFGIVQIEAMACAKPVVNTDLPSGVPYVSPHNLSGFTVPPANAEALARAINRLLASKELSSQMGCNGRLRVEQEFTNEIMVRRTLCLYEKSLS